MILAFLLQQYRCFGQSPRAVLPWPGFFPPFGKRGVGFFFQTGNCRVETGATRTEILLLRNPVFGLPGKFLQISRQLPVIIHPKPIPMAAAYFVASYNVNDQDAYNEYLGGVIHTLQKYDCEVLIADFNPKKLEGEPNHATIVLKFPSDEKANGWYNDPDYAPLKEKRINATSGGFAVIAQHFVPPSA